MLFFGRLESISRDNGVTVVLAQNRISALIDIFFGNALRYRHFGCLSSVVRSFTRMYKRNFEISWNFYKHFYHYFWDSIDAKQFWLFG